MTTPRDPEEITAAGAPARADVPAATRMGAVHLSVADLARSIDYYESAIGLRVHARDGDRVRLGTGGEGGFTKLSDGGGRVFGGTTFTFTPPSAGNRIKLRGIVDVEWRQGRRVRSHTQVITHGGHQSGIDPLLALSAPFCEITR